MSTNYDSCTPRGCEVCRECGAHWINKHGQHVEGCKSTNKKDSPMEQEAPRKPHHVYVVLSHPPGPESQFVELEDFEGNSIDVGEWGPTGHLHYSLEIPVLGPKAGQEYSDALKKQRQDETLRANTAESDLRDTVATLNETSKLLARAKKLGIKVQDELNSTKEALGVVREDRNKMIKRLKPESGAAAGRYEKLRKERDSLTERLKDECDATKSLTEELQAYRDVCKAGPKDRQRADKLQAQVNELKAGTQTELDSGPGLTEWRDHWLKERWLGSYATEARTAFDRARTKGLDSVPPTAAEIKEADKRPTVHLDLGEVSGVSPEVVVEIRKQSPNGAMVTPEGLKPMPQDLRTKEEKVLEFLDRLNTWFDLEDKTSRANAAKALLDLVGR